MQPPADNSNPQEPGPPDPAAVVESAASAQVPSEAAPRDHSSFGSFVEGFCAGFSAGLSRMLNLPAQAQLASLEQLPHESFPRNPPGDRCYLFRAIGPSGQADALAVEFGAQTAFVIVDRLLGGPEDGAFIPDRPLTGIERRLLRRAAGLAGDCIARSWPDRPSPRLELAEEAPAREVPDSPAAPQAVWAVAFSVKIARQAGEIRLCIPCSLANWNAPRSLAAEAPAAPEGQYLPQAPRAEGPIELSVAVEGTTLPLEDLANLAGGDIVTTDTPAEGEVIVRIAGIPKFAARLGTSDGRRAITITRRIT